MEQKKQFEKRYIGLASSQPSASVETQQPLSDFERNLESRKLTMLKEINYDVKKLETTETRLKNVSELMAVFSSKVVEQDSTTEQIVQLAEDSLRNIKGANKELVMANTYNESYGRYWAVLFMTMSIILILLHLLKD